MRSGHRMRFGAEIHREGVRFSLWAPGAGQVELCLEGREAPLSVERDDAGCRSPHNKSQFSSNKLLAELSSDE